MTHSKVILKEFSVMREEVVYRKVIKTNDIPTGLREQALAPRWHLGWGGRISVRAGAEISVYI